MCLCVGAGRGAVRVCYYNGYGGWTTASRGIELTQAFQKTWPRCRNGHHFTVQCLRPSVEASARTAQLKTVSGGLLRSVKPERLEEGGSRKQELLVTFPESSCTESDACHLTITWLNGGWTRGLPFRCF